MCVTKGTNYISVTTVKLKKNVWIHFKHKKKIYLAGNLIDGVVIHITWLMSYLNQEICIVLITSETERTEKNECIELDMTRYVENKLVLIKQISNYHVDFLFI